MGKKMKISVMGGGNSAQTMAADLALMGHEVTLCDLPRFAKSIRPLVAKREIEKCGSLGSAGRVGVARLKNVTTDVGTATRGANLILIAVPAYGHINFFKALEGHLEDDQIVVIFPGNWGALRFYQWLKARGFRRKIIIAETSRCMHICRAAERWLGAGKVRVVLERGTVQIAAIPARNTKRVHSVLKTLYPNVVPGRHVLETSLNNGNIVVHGPLVLMNAGWVEHTQGQFMIYRDGVTPSVGRAIDAIGDERDQILRALGLSSPHREPFYEQNRDAEWPHDPCEVGPPSLSHRYISEDIPYGLVPLSYLGDLTAVKTPASDAMIELSSIANRVDYWKEGITMKKLGLDGLSVKEILRYVTLG